MLYVRGRPGRVVWTRGAIAAAVVNLLADARVTRRRFSPRPPRSPRPRIRRRRGDPLPCQPIPRRPSPAGAAPPVRRSRVTLIGKFGTTTLPPAQTLVARRSAVTPPRSLSSVRRLHLTAPSVIHADDRRHLHSFPPRPSSTVEHRQKHTPLRLCTALLSIFHPAAHCT